MYSRSFIEKLLVRLKSGDARSIHLNALPGNFARLDVYDLANIEPSLHLKFLQLLLGKNSFRFTITVEPELLNKKEEEKDDEKKKIIQKIIKRLNHLDYQEKEEFSEHGYHSFGFGYPLLIKRDPNNSERIIKAPLLIWYLNIEKDHRRNNTWTISREEEHPLIFNELLQSHFESAEKIKTDDLEALIEEDFINEAQLIAFCKALLHKLNIPFDEVDNIATLLPVTNKETIENVMRETAWIRWSGVFGLYKMQKQSIIKDVENLLNEPEEITDAAVSEEIYFNGEVLTPIPLDPSQENVLHQLKQTNTVIIQGPPGTGKSQSLTAIITQALLNKQKVLVVCEKRTAMEVLHNNLRKENLHQLCVLIEDVYADRKNIVESVRNRVEQSGEIQNRFRNHEYELARSKFLSLRKEINHRLNFSGKQVFGDDHWLELLTRSCELNRKKVVLEKANSIHKTLINSAYSFNYEEYISLSEKIKETNTMYFKVDRTAFIFDTLNPHIFTGDISTQQLFESLEGQYNYSAELEKMILLNISNSNDSYNSLSGIIKTVVDILSVFLPKFKAIRKQKKKTIQDYQTLASFCEKHNYCSSAFMNLKGVSKIDELLPSIQKIKQQTSDLLLHKNVFQNYDNYRRLFEQQEEKTQSIIAALISTNSLDWFDIFETYYINQVVLKTAMENGIRDNTEKLYNELKEADILLRQKLSEKINFTWHEVIEEKIKTRDLSEVKYLYNQRKNKQFASRNSLRKIIHEDFEFFSTLFPVIMLNPSVSTSVLPLQQNLFDFIILDEASQLRLEDTFSSLLRGQTKIVSGDKHQMPPSNFFANDVVFWNEEEENDAGNFLAESRSLLEYADDADYKNSYLDYHYRSLHPDLIQFSNHAFYNSRLIPLPEKKEYTPIHYYNVEGTYGEGMNPQEAAEIVRFIYQCKKIDDEYPSIGIATFNIYQRDLIYDMLYEEAYGDKEKNDQLQSLLNKGLFVKNLENIQGDERDIMILSTTFGKDIHGRFRQSFGPLTQEKGYQLLNVIITRAKHSMYVFTSIPENIFLNFGEELSQKGNTGKSIFYAYLSYVKACYENDESQKMFIESMLEKNNAARILKNVHDGNIFKDLVFGELKKVFKEELIQNYKLGGFNLDLVILKDDKPFLHIDFENTQNYLPEVTYRIKLHKEKMVTGYGISTYHLWSYSWWRDSEKEIENISSVMNT